MSGKALLLAGAVAVLPPVAGQAATKPSEGVSRAFAPSDAPFVLTRTIWRTLVDGKQIMVKRRYAVQFSRSADGYVLDGHLLDAAVDAPALLSSLAELERDRADEGMFPLLLDTDGRIRQDANSSPEPLALRNSAEARAQEMLTKAPLPSAQRQESGMFLAQLAAQGAMAAWPADLFNPAAAEHREHRRIALPGGHEGEVAVSIKVFDQQPEGLPRAVERTVTTLLEGASRTSREQWTLAPAEPMLR